MKDTKAKKAAIVVGNTLGAILSSNELLTTDVGNTLGTILSSNNLAKSGVEILAKTGAGVLGSIVAGPLGGPLGVALFKAVAGCINEFFLNKALKGMQLNTDIQKNQSYQKVLVLALKETIEISDESFEEIVDKYDTEDRHEAIKFLRKLNKSIIAALKDDKLLDDIFENPYQSPHMNPADLEELSISEIFLSELVKSIMKVKEIPIVIEEVLVSGDFCKTYENNVEEALNTKEYTPVRDKLIETLAKRTKEIALEIEAIVKENNELLKETKYKVYENNKISKSNSVQIEVNTMYLEEVLTIAKKIISNNEKQKSYHKSPFTVIDNFIKEYSSHKNTVIPFGGRDEYIEKLDQWIEKENSPYALMTAKAGRGKSALVVHWYLSLMDQDNLNVIFVPISIRQKFNSAELVYPYIHRVLRQIKESHQIEYEDYFDNMQEESSFILQMLEMRHIKTLLIFDGVDEADADLEIATFLDTINIYGYSFVKILLTARKMKNLTTTKLWADKLKLAKYHELPKLPLLKQASICDIINEVDDKKNTLAQIDDLDKWLYKLSDKGEPLLVKLYIDELLRVNLSEDDRPLKIDDLKNMKPGYEGYFDYWLTPLIEDKEVRINDVSYVLFILAFAKAPIEFTELKELIRLIVDYNSFDLIGTLNRLSRVIYISGGEYVLAHPALAKYLQELDSDNNRAFIDVSVKNIIILGFVVWFKNVFEGFDVTKNKQASYPQYVKNHIIGHVIDYHNYEDIINYYDVLKNYDKFKDIEVDMDYFSLIITKKCLKLYYKLDGHFNNYKKLVSICYDYYLDSITQNNDSVNIKFSTSLVLMSELNCYYNNMPTKLYLEIMKNYRDEDKLLSERQIIEQISMFYSEKKKSDSIEVIWPYLTEVGKEKVLYIIEKLKNKSIKGYLMALTAKSLRNDKKQEILEQALAIAFKIEDKLTKIEILGMIAKNSKEDKKQEIKERLNQELASAIEIENATQKAQLLVAIANNCEEDHKQEILEQALISASKIENILTKIEILGIIAHDSKEDKKQEVNKILKQILISANKIEFEQYKATVLEKIVENCNGDKEILMRVIEIVIKLEDDTWKMFLLAKISEKSDRCKEMLIVILLIIMDVENEFDASVLFEFIAENCEVDKNNKIVMELLASTSNIQDEFNRVKILGMIVENCNSDKEILVKALSIANKIEKCWNLAEVLEKIVENCNSDKEILEQGLTIVKKIKSGRHKLDVLEKIVANCYGDEAILSQTMLVATNINREVQKVEALIKVAQNNEGDNKREILEQALVITSKIEFRLDIANILEMIAANSEGNKEILSKTLAIAKKIETDREKAEVLQIIAENCEGNKEILSKTLAIAKKIETDWEKAEVLQIIAENCDGDINILAQVFEAICKDDEVILTERLNQEMLKMISESVLFSDKEVEMLRGLLEKKTENWEEDKIIEILEHELTIAKKIESEWKKAIVLRIIAENCEGDINILEQALTIAYNFENEWEKAKVLETIVKNCEGDINILEQALTIAYNFENEWEKARVLETIVKNCEGDINILEQALTIAYNFENDWEKAKVLETIVKNCEGNKEILSKALTIAKKIESELEKAKILGIIAKNFEVDKKITMLNQALAIFDKPKNRWSKNELIKSIAKNYAGDKEILSRVLSLVEKIESETGTVEKVVLETIAENCEGDKKILSQVLAIAKKIESDWGKAEVLQIIVENCENNKEILSQVFTIANNIADRSKKVEIFRSLFYTDLNTDEKIRILKKLKNIISGDLDSSIELILLYDNNVLNRNKDIFFNIINIDEWF